MSEDLDPSIKNMLDELEGNEPVSKELVKDAEVISTIDKKKDELQLKLLKLIEGHCENAEKMISDVESDRSKCDDVYNILINKLQNNDYHSADVAGVVSLLQTKVEGSKVRALMMQEVARLLASLRNNNTIGEHRKDDDLSPQELNKLLSGEMPSDD
jgi:hypothetical protein